MDYLLAKELKEAGFPQEGRVFVEEDNVLIACCFDKSCYCPKCQGDGGVVVPTLSELIEACGEEFYELARLGNDVWQMKALSESEKQLPLMYRGKTPEEAVARLWLALNKK